MDTIFFFVSIVKTIVSIVVKHTPPFHIAFASALPNALHGISVAPSIRRAKS